MLSIGDIAVSPAVVLAPMAGITDRPFRDLVARFGAGLVVSEMVATDAALAARPSVRARAEIAAGAPASAVQLMGREPGQMAEAARRLASDGARIIDINMGCPAKKVTTGAAGAALLREPDLALRIVDAVIGAVAGAAAVTIKMRLGWETGRPLAPALAPRLEAAGVAAITVHGRARCQFYDGAADWAAIGEVVAAVRVPVIANGDIRDAASARAALAASGAAGVMVGRGACGAPWALAEIAAGLAGRASPARPRGRALARLIAEHYEAMLSFHGRETGRRIARKHLGWYLDPLPGGPALRARLVRLEAPEAVLAGVLEGVAALDDGERMAA